MPAIQYPFIDIAVHANVRARFARGEALVLFSPDLARVLWANGAGAQFFGNVSIYDFLDHGPNRQDVTFRQLQSTARPLSAVGDSRSLLVRLPTGFQRVPVQAMVELVQVKPGENVVLFSVPVTAPLPDVATRARAMLSGFDDPDTHMALLDGDGQVIAASEKFADLGLTAHTAKTLVNLVGGSGERLLKRPIPTGRGYLPAAIGKLSDDPALHLLFTIETILGQMDPTRDFDEGAPAASVPAVEEAFLEEPAAASAAGEPIVHEPAANAFDAVVTAIGGIEDIDEELETVIEDAAENADSPLVEMAEDVSTGDASVFERATGDEQSAPSEQADAEPAEGETETDIVPEAQTDSSTAEMAESDDTVTVDEADPNAEIDNASPTATVIEADDTPASIDEPALAADDAILSVDEPVASGDDAREVETAAAEASEPALAEDASPLAEADTAGEPTFAFVPGTRASRFVWKIDAEGRFSDVSPEFALAVGPLAAGISGQSFAELAARYHLDPEGRIADLLKKRDTWSGKTIHWPVEGTALMVPVDLAALPTYSRSRDFDGFRGFGIVRMADAVEDPNAFGLSFAAAPAAEQFSVAADRPTAFAPVADADPTRQATEEAATDPDDSDANPVGETSTAADTTVDRELTELAADIHAAEDEAVPAAEDTIEDDEPDLFLSTASTPPPARPAGYEPPALAITETPNRRQSDKVIQLEDRRGRNKDGLTPAEQAAFREIARKLESFGSSDDDAAALPSYSADDRPAAPSTGGRETPAASDMPAAPREPAEDVGSVAPIFPAQARSESGLTPEIVDLMPVALLIHVGDRLIHGNPEFWRLTGYASLAALDTAGGLDALLQRADIEETSEHAGRVMVVRADDELVPVSARLQSVRFEQSSALMLALMPANAREEELPVDAAGSTDPMHAGADHKARLQVEVEELRSILETATDGVVILGANGDIRSMNRSASALFNYDEEETRGKPFVMLYAHESQKAILDYLAGLSGHGVASVLNDGREVIGREASGGFFPLFMTIGRLTSSDGYCAVIRDITQWKRTEEELRSAKRAAETANAHKSDFLARVSHEIRTPLNAIIGFADMMAGERFGPIGHPRYAEYANDIGRSGRHVLDIVNDLLDISKIEAGEMDLDFVSVGLNETVASAVSIVQPQANSQRVIIRTALSQAVPDVVADPRSIRQIALNILANAIRFTPSGGQIIVSTAYEANGSVILRIRDTGIGMSRTELEQAMKPFRQVAGAAQHRGDGTGLGLPLTKAMVDANRANFSIHSSPNEGTLVEITFPPQRVLAN